MIHRYIFGSSRSYAEAWEEYINRRQKREVAGDATPEVDEDDQEEEKDE